ncbi:Right handed beta helix region [Neorhodopirellula lusitana]|uniref:Right handed beta helix region n=1 Tax=Neorhodopirellula lusitana TaxID=445327 RepID=A0ABY1QGK0_9BACT|nr:right-handed parallel beta-helix repeat-containing protein [Neorhodopirellula lusitana]SMP69006.1 Right handed beta helix region [Neorhodopirellula lusitana]
MKSILATIALFLLASHCVLAGDVINVADHGIVPGEDATPKVNRLIESLEGQSGVTLEFPKGVYEFYPEHAIEKFRAVTNHDNSLKRLAFPLFGLEDFTLDGGGSTFLFYGRICPITLFQCGGVTLKNFSIDWDTPFHHELKVVQRNEKDNSFVAEISPMKHGFEVTDGKLLLNHYDWQDMIGQNIAMDPKTNAPYWQTKRYLLKAKSAKATKVGENRVRLQAATKVPPPVGAVLCTYGNAPTNRLAQAIHVDQSKDTTIENVTVYAAGGMALIAERSENISLDNVVVTSTEKRVLATRADATHFLGCKGLVKLTNCRFEHMADDGINVHGAYIKINEFDGERTFQCEISHRQQTGLVFAEPGDKVMITSRQTVLPIYETTVEDVVIHDQQFVSITLKDVPSDLPAGPLSLENLTWYPDVEMRDNVIRDNRARGALISTKGKVLIENNVFSNQMHGILIEGDNKAWYESGGVRDVTITNNLFGNIGYGTGENYPLYVSPLLLPEQNLGDDQYHGNVRFMNNRLKSFNGLLAYAVSVKGLVLSGNVIELSEDYPTGSELPSIELDHCKQVTIQDNQFIGFDWPLRVKQSVDNTEVVIKNNQGLSVPSDQP